MLTIFILIDMWLGFRHGGDVDVEIKLENERMIRELHKECVSIYPGITIVDAEILLSSFNRRTKTVSTSGEGNIKYWISTPIYKNVPQGGVCKVSFGSEHIIKNVLWLPEGEKEKGVAH